MLLTVLKIAAAVALTLDLLATGLSVELPGVLAELRRPARLIGAIIAVDFFVPTAALVVLKIIPTVPTVTVGIALMAASPVGSFALGSIVKSGGSATYATTLHMLLGTLAVVTTPLTLAFLGRALDVELVVAPGAVAKSVAGGVVLPLAAGIVLGALSPQVARMSGHISKVVRPAILAVLALAVVLDGKELLAVDPLSYLAMMLTIIAAFAIGHFMGPRMPGQRLTLAVECAARNPALAILIASVSFPSTRAAPVLVPYVALFAVLGIFYMRAMVRGGVVPASQA